MVRFIQSISSIEHPFKYPQIPHTTPLLGLRTVRNRPYTVRLTSLAASVRIITAVTVVYTAVLVVAGYIIITSMNTMLNV